MQVNGKEVFTESEVGILETIFTDAVKDYTDRNKVVENASEETIARIRRQVTTNARKHGLALVASTAVALAADPHRYEIAPIPNTKDFVYNTDSDMVGAEGEALYFLVSVAHTDRTPIPKRASNAIQVTVTLGRGVDGYFIMARVRFVVADPESRFAPKHAGIQGKWVKLSHGIQGSAIATSFHLDIFKNASNRSVVQIEQIIAQLLEENHFTETA